MAGVVYMRSNSVVSLTGSEYTGVTPKTKTLYLQTGTASTDRLRYGLTTDTSASVYSPIINLQSDIESWNSFINDLPYTCCDNELLVYNGELHNLAGYDPSKTNGVNQYHYKWNGSTWVSASTLPYRLAGCIAVVYNNKIHIFGGDANWADDKKAHYSWDGNSWTKLTDIPTGIRMGSAIVYDNKIHLFGSYDDGVYYHYIWNGSNWSTGTLPFSTTGYDTLRAVVYNGEIHLFRWYYHYKWNGSSWVDVETLSKFVTSYGKFVSLNNKLYALGVRGEGNYNQHCCFIYDGISWQVSADLPHYIDYVGGVTVYENSIVYAAGREENYTYYSNVYKGNTPLRKHYIARQNTYQTTRQSNYYSYYTISASSSTSYESTLNTSSVRVWSYQFTVNNGVVNSHFSSTRITTGPRPSEIYNLTLSTANTTATYTIPYNGVRYKYVGSGYTTYLHRLNDGYWENDIFRYTHWTYDGYSYSTGSNVKFSVATIFTASVSESYRFEQNAYFVPEELNTRLFKTLAAYLNERQAIYSHAYGALYTHKSTASSTGYDYTMSSSTIATLTTYSSNSESLYIRISEGAARNTTWDIWGGGKTYLTHNVTSMTYRLKNYRSFSSTYFDYSYYTNTASKNYTNRITYSIKTSSNTNNTVSNLSSFNAMSTSDSGWFTRYSMTPGAKISMTYTLGTSKGSTLISKSDPYFPGVYSQQRIIDRTEKLSASSSAETGYLYSRSARVTMSTDSIYTSRTSTYTITTDNCNA